MFLGAQLIGNLWPTKPNREIYTEKFTYLTHSSLSLNSTALFTNGIVSLRRKVGFAMRKIVVASALFLGAVLSCKASEAGLFGRGGGCPNGNCSAGRSTVYSQPMAQVGKSIEYTGIANPTPTQPQKQVRAQTEGTVGSKPVSFELPNVAEQPVRQYQIQSFPTGNRVPLFRWRR